jgi:hypothetical protein
MVIDSLMIMITYSIDQFVYGLFVVTIITLVSSRMNAMVIDLMVMVTYFTNQCVLLLFFVDS